MKKYIYMFDFRGKGVGSVILRLIRMSVLLKYITMIRPLWIIMWRQKAKDCSINL